MEADDWHAGQGGPEEVGAVKEWKNNGYGFVETEKTEDSESYMVFAHHDRFLHPEDRQQAAWYGVKKGRIVAFKVVHTDVKNLPEARDMRYTTDMYGRDTIDMQGGPPDILGRQQTRGAT